MFDVKVKDKRVPNTDLIERLELDEIMLVLQQNRLHWYWDV